MLNPLNNRFLLDTQVVLMKGHGMAVRGFSVRDAVFRSFYTQQDATVQLQARLLGGHNTGLTAREAMDAENTTESDNLCVIFLEY